MNINPLGNIAEVVALTPPENKTSYVWQNRDNANVFGPAPVKNDVNWKPLTTWETLRKIQSFMADVELLNGLNDVQLKGIKNYCVKVIQSKGSILDIIWSFIKHYFRDGCMNSTWGAASDILSHVYQINNNRKNRLPLENFQPEFEFFYSGSEGPSRLYNIENEKYEDLKPAQKGVGFINGIQNSFNDAKMNAEYLATLTGEEIELEHKALHPVDVENTGMTNWLTKFLQRSEKPPVIVKGIHIHGVYNAVHGVFADLKECWYGWWGYNTKPARKVIKMWEKFFHENPNGKFLMVCHSQGAIHVKHALAVFPEHLRKKIEVLAIAPGVYINPKHCGRVVHYVSKKDIIHRFDWKARRNVIDLTAHANASKYIPDHSFQSLTFKKHIRQNLVEFLKS